MKTRICQIFAIVLLISSIALVFGAEQSKKKGAFMFSDESDWAENRGQDFPNWEAKEKWEVKGLTDDPKHETYSGHIKVHGENKDSLLFYVLHSKKQGTLKDKAPLIIWFQGGPGCSSLFGNMQEIGPVFIEDWDEKTGRVSYDEREYQWADTNHLLFIDQPVGTGYSTLGDKAVRSTNAAAKDVYTFLLRFFSIYPELLNNQVYLFGESYAGHYIPAIAHEIWRQKTTNHINMVGIGIGNGWIDPINQIGFFDYYAYAAGLVSPVGRDIITNYQNEAILDIMNMNLGSATNLFDNCTTYIEKVNPGINIYNFREFNKSHDKTLNEWANHVNTKNMFNVPDNLKFVSCNQGIYNNFSSDISESYAWALQQIAGQIKILIFSGQDDIICNSAGTNNFINNFNFPKSDDIRTVNKKLWTINDYVVGTVQLKGKFYYAVVNSAGHMVPMDQPRIARDMLSHFINGDQEWIALKPEPTETKTEL